jgi:hypothetical protein
MALTKVKGSGLATGAATASLVGIDDNATSTAITIDASQNAVIGGTVTSNARLTLEGTDGGNSAGLYLNNTTATNGKSYSVTSGNSGEFMLYDRTSSAYRLVVDSSGNVGIGTSSPSYPLHVSSSSATSMARFDGVNSTNFFIANNSANLITLQASGSGGISFNTSGGNERLRILPAGGITFNGDTAAANALDDYEEGTFTMKFRRTSGTWINSTSPAYYTKIGNRVFVTLRSTLPTDLSTANGGSYVRVGGLPYSVSGSSTGSMILRYAKSVPGGDLSWYIVDEGYIFETATNSGSLAHSYIDTGTDIQMFGSYIVA